MSSLLKLSVKFLRSTKKCNILLPIRSCTTTTTKDEQNSPKFETVFAFPSVKYIALLNRLKIYQMIATSVAIPATGLLSFMDIVSSETFLFTSYVGVTGAAVLTLSTLPFRNIIGFLYLSEDNQKIKISSLDFWGKRKDRIIDTKDWVPLLDLPSKTTDPVYLTAHLSDGSKYRLLIAFGKVYDAKRMAQVLE